MNDVIVDTFNRLIDEQINSVKDALANGGANSIEHYRKQVGYIAGLRYAKETMDSVIKSYMNE